MNIGILRKKITIQSSTVAASATGEPVQTWAAYATDRWAEFGPEKVSEAFSAQKIRSEDNVTFRIRHIAGVTPKMRVVYDGENYDIVSVVNTGARNRELLIEAVKRA